MPALGYEVTHVGAKKVLLALCLAPTSRGAQQDVGLGRYC